MRNPTRTCTGYRTLLALLMTQSIVWSAVPVGTEITYQGQLKQNGQPVSGATALMFSLFDAPVKGKLAREPLVFDGSAGGHELVPVTNGLFTVKLDFGPGAFSGDARWLEVAVQSADGTGYTVLSPRQSVTAAPYALHVRGLNIDESGGLQTTGDIQTIGTVAAQAYGTILTSESPTVAGGNCQPNILGVCNGNNFIECARIDPACNFGIGETNPLAKLHIGGTPGTDGLMFPDGTLQTTAATGGGGGFWTDNGSNISNTNSGNVGIGNTNPTAKLDVWNVDFGWAIFGLAINGDGVVGQTAADFLSGVYGIGGAASAYGVRGRHGSTQNEGFLGTKDYGVWGKALADDKWAGYFDGRGYFSGNVGVGTNLLLAQLHVEGNDLSLADTALINDVLVVEGSDAVMGLYSGGGGNWGSAVIFGEVDGGGNLVDKWALTRRTVSGGSSLRFTYGTNSNYGSNPTLMILTDEGDVGIGTSTPAAKLDVRTNSAGTALLVQSSGTSSVVSWFNASGGTSASNAILATSGSNSHPTVLIVNSGSGRALDVTGTARIDVLEISGADLAEKFPVSEEVKPGMVLAIDVDNPGKLHIARGAYNRRVAGAVSGANGLAAGTILGNLPGSENHPPVALNGRVWVYCDATEYAIEPGVLLTTSDTPGHAMAVTDHARAMGATLGKAMTALAKGERGLVLVLVNLQ